MSGLSFSLSLPPPSHTLSLSRYVYICGRIVTLATPAAARLLSRLSDLLRAFSHGSPHGSLRGSNASRQSVFYCVHAQEASIINLTEEYHDLLPSAFDPRALSLSALCLSLRFPGLFGAFVRKELPAVKRLLSRCERRSSARIDRVPLFSIRRLELRSTIDKEKLKHARLTMHRINI